MTPDQFKVVDGYVVVMKQILGQGAFGTVVRGYKESDPKQIIAVKVLPLNEMNKMKNYVKLVKREIEILQKIESPYIVKLLHVARTANNYYMFLEFCNSGDLRSLLKSKNGYLSEQEALTYLRHIIYGFMSIYQENAIHRDIKPANILLHNGVAKLSDFGFARVVDDMEGADALTLLGTPLYMSPQILSKKLFSSKCDIWSLGMTFYEMLYGHTPWTANSQDALYNHILRQSLIFPNVPKRSEAVKDLIRKMLAVEEEQRISWYELFEHDLIKIPKQKVQEKISSIKDSVNDPLEQSAQLNQLYVENNKVLAQGNKDNNLFTIKEQDTLENLTSPDATTPLMSPDDISPGMTYNDIVNSQTKRIQEQSIVNKIDHYLTHMRNIGIFVNQTTNNTFQLFKEQTIQIPMHLFYRIIFILQKYQMILFEELTNIMASKIFIGNGFSEPEWRLYKKSSEYFTTLKAIKTDKSYIKPYYEQITNRTTSYLVGQVSSLPAQQKKEIEEFISIIQMGLVKDIAFNNVYEKVIIEVVKEMLAKISDQNKFNRLYMQTLRYLSICSDIDKQFRWGQEVFDFNKFYEKYDTIEMEQLNQEIQANLQNLK